jgi:hypothetical protein
VRRSGIVCRIEPATVDFLVQFGHRQGVSQTIHQFLRDSSDSRDGIGIGILGLASQILIKSLKLG